MDMLFDVLTFALKGAVVVAAIIIVTAMVMTMARRGRRDEGRMHVQRLNARFRDLADTVRSVTMPPRAFRRYLKLARRSEKAPGSDNKRRVFVLDFRGDIAATGVVALREEISAILMVAQTSDEVVLRLESSGGVVHAYGLAASQLARIKQKGIRLIVCVDKVAASGGYMMACLADDLIAAPFAVLGSIGVVAPVPNLNRLLERHGVDYEEMTAGEFKRTVSFLGKISEEGRRKFKEQLEETHGLFKDFVREHRPSLDMDKIATGEHWFGKRALELNLVDRLQTSDDYLLSRVETADLLHVSYRPPQPWRRRVAEAVSESTERLLLRSLTRTWEARFP